MTQKVVYLKMTQLVDEIEQCDSWLEYETAKVWTLPGHGNLGDLPLRCSMFPNHHGPHTQDVIFSDGEEIRVQWIDNDS